MADNITVQINNRTIRQQAADNISVSIISQHFFSGNAYHLSAVVNDFSFGINMPDNVTVAVDNRTVGQNPSEDIAVCIIGKIIAAARPFNRTDQITVCIGNFTVGSDFANHFAVGIHYRSVRQNFTDDIAVFVVSHFLTGQLTQQLAGFIYDFAVLDVADNISVFVGYRTIGVNIAD